MPDQRSSSATHERVTNTGGGKLARPEQRTAGDGVGAQGVDGDVVDLTRVEEVVFGPGACEIDRRNGEDVEGEPRLGRQIVEGHRQQLDRVGDGGQEVFTEGSGDQEPGGAAGHQVAERGVARIGVATERHLHASGPCGTHGRARTERPAQPVDVDPVRVVRKPVEAGDVPFGDRIEDRDRIGLGRCEAGCCDEHRGFVRAEEVDRARRVAAGPRIGPPGDEVVARARSCVRATP